MGKQKERRSIVANVIAQDIEQITKLVPHGSGVRMTRIELKDLLRLAWAKGAEYYVSRIFNKTRRR